MFSWAQQQLAHVAGTQEPVYGPSAIQPVTEKAKSVPYTEISREDQKWITPKTSCVETQTFYITADAGHVAFVQVIYSNVAVSTTCQFNTQIYYLDDGKTPHLWSSDALENFTVGSDRTSFTADKCSITLAEDGNSYTIKSSTNLKSIVSVKVTKAAPALVIGEDGNTYYGKDLTKPWGSMRHSFWPRCTVEGSILTKDGEVNLNGKGIYIHGLQGMKPHHCAARWNFVDFQSPTYSAVMMEFTTPPSYGSTVVNVGAIVIDGKVLFAGATNTAEHTEIKGDSEVDWPEPSAAKYIWRGKTADGKDIEAVLEGSLGERTARVDVMSELPGIVKSLAQSASGTRPYIYQFTPKMTLKLKTEDEVKEEEGQVFLEATFIS